MNCHLRERLAKLQWRRTFKSQRRSTLHLNTTCSSFMRFFFVSTLLRTIYSGGPLRAATRPQIAAGKAYSPAVKSSMPTIPFLGALFGTSKRKDDMSFPVNKADSEWKAQLSPEQFRVLRQQGTEAPFSGKYDKHYPDKGVYTCAGCEAPLYTAEQKFKSGCGWPAFYDTVPGAVTRNVDRTFGMERIEIVCSNCGGHLGHVFKGEGYGTPTDERHCVNSISINFSSDDKVVDKSSKA